MFSFFKRINQSKYISSQLILLVGYVPDGYKENRHYLNCLEFIAHYEFELAIDSLIEFFEETEYCFPDIYWFKLADLTALMKLQDKKEYCYAQIKELP